MTKNATLRRFLPLAVVAIISSIVTSIVVVTYVFPKQIGNTASAQSTLLAQAGPFDMSGGALPSIADVAAAVGPAVVRIDTTRVVQYGPPSRTPVDPFFDMFFGSSLRDFLGGGTREQAGTGSGFIIKPNGYIVTNYHVVEGAQKIQVTLSDGRKFDASVAGSRKDSDLALIKIDAKDLPIAVIGDSKDLRPGDWVIAIGNPYGFDHTVTAGIVSAVGRQVDDGSGSTLATGDLIQTDASINQGNSGGPLINMEGKVVGINTAIIPYAQGIGFAIAVDSVKDAITDIIANPDANKPAAAKTGAKRPWLGIEYQPLDEDLAKLVNAPDANGALIVDVMTGSPAEKAGLQRRDVIQEINGKQLSPKVSLADEISKSKVGDKVLLLVFRDGKRMYISVKLGESPNTTP